MIVEKLPDLVQAAASPLTKIGQMTVLSSGGDSVGASKITGDVMNVAAQSLAMVKGLTGIDIAEALRRDREKGIDGKTAKDANSTRVSN